MTPRQAVEAFYDRVWNRGDKAAIPELIHDDFTFHGSLGPIMTGHAAFSTYVDGVTEALADYRCLAWAGAALFTLKSDKIADLWGPGRPAGAARAA
jgi:hypothetical protein